MTHLYLQDIIVKQHMIMIIRQLSGDLRAAQVNIHLRQSLDRSLYSPLSRLIRQNMKNVDITILSYYKLFGTIRNTAYFVYNTISYINFKVARPLQLQLSNKQ